MSSPTAEQQKAIDTRGKNIIVSAGAGSGKTFVLKERVLKEVQNETSVGRSAAYRCASQDSSSIRGITIPS